MLTEKQQRQRALERERCRRLLCTKCGAVMIDAEPMSPNGEFYHRANGCTNGGRYFDWEVPRTEYGPERVPRHGKYVLDPSNYGRKKYIKEAVSGIVQMNYSSRERRARKRGAKLASKYRPK